MPINHAPSLNSLTRIKGVTEEIATAIREAIHNCEDTYVTHNSRRIRAILDLIPVWCNGAEVIIPNRTGIAPIIYYANMGNTYDTTLICTLTSGKYSWRIGSWGDIVERYRGYYD